MATRPADLLSALEDLTEPSRLIARLGGGFTPALWVVGGAVRDLLLGRVPADVDLIVDGPLGPVAAALGGEPVRHERFLTARVGGVDLARARRETYPRPGALPTVAPATVAEDLRRRDFTVNTFAVCLTGPERGTLRCAPTAERDLAERQLATLHERSFLDDPTRLVRLARYAARLDFSVEERTRDEIEAALTAGVLTTVTGVRIGNELRKLLCEPDPVRAMVALRELKIDGRIATQLGLIDDQLARRALALLEPEDRRDRTVLAAALLGSSAEVAAQLLDRWGFPAEDRDVIARTVAQAERVSRRLEYASAPSEIDWAAGGPDSDPELIALAGAIHPANAAREWLVELRHRRLAIGGADLLTAGVPAGPAIARGLAAARAAMLDDEAPDAASQLAAALAAL
ncbi:hypothetical protein [Conexibacter sp. DBS9H8]|uniref:hypothetical protein n=1 Tax=Conexibacter sp. DBS9H8 TaxID=2937801 RepID=UPI002010B3D5|nr:hypothetical protein [Conexibacter sp. DBS9H8]